MAGKHIDQFSEQLRTKLSQIDTSLRDLKSKIDSKAHNAEQEARAHLDKLEKGIAQEQTKVSAAQAEMKNWAEVRKVDTQAKIAEWKSKLEISKLKNRAELAERFSAAAIVVAAAAAEEAARASIEAWLARHDVDSTSAKQPARV